jgi:hypothetical protein
MAYQFIHVEGYARSAGRGKTGGHTLASIVAEAERRPGACPHVVDPQPARVVYGKTPAVAAEAAALWAETSKDARGHKLRRDGLCMLGGVVSVPEGFEGWPKYRKAAVAWLKEEYGPALLSVVEHTDEGHPHLHFYAVPWQSDRFDAIHPGLRAAAAADPDRGRRTRPAAEKEAGRKNARLAFTEAMRAFQDRFYRGVGAIHGMARLGPKRRRLTRAAWRAEEQQRKELAAVMAQTDKTLEKVVQERAAVERISAEYPAAKLARLVGSALQGVPKEKLADFWKSVEGLGASLRAQTATEARQGTQTRPDGKSHGKGR